MSNFGVSVEPDECQFYSLLCYLIAGWMTLPKSLNLSEVQFSYLQNGATYNLFQGLTVKINWNDAIEVLESLSHNNRSVNVSYYYY